MTDTSSPTVLYADANLLIIEKPAGLLSVPGKNPLVSNLIDEIKRDYPTARIVHRLDMATSGLMVIALDAESHKLLGKQFEKRAVKKTYEAVTTGLIRDDEGLIDLPLICDWPNRPRQMVDHSHGKSAQTNFHVLERYQAAEQTRVALFPITGRSHQLRVHLSAIGHAILGCEFYANESAKNAAPRLLLHATHLSFYHPVSNDFISFNSPAPF